MFRSKILFSVFFIQFLVITVLGQYRYDCDEKFCSRNAPKCSHNECQEGYRLIRNATECGCCHLCIEQLKQGDKCETQKFAVIPKKECGPRLVCGKETSTCVPAKTRCVRDLAEYEKSSKYARIDKVKPECDEFGFYKPVQCIPGVMCYCVNKDGKRIFGTDLMNRYESMQCDCSREYEEFPRHIPSGDFLRCTSNGNYDDLQCTEKWCYCTGDRYSGVGITVEAGKNTQHLLCYDKKRHEDDNDLLRSRCWRERNTLLNQIAEHKMNGTTVIGVELPNCELDGSYNPVRCEKESCYCVKKNGEQYGRSKYKRNYLKAKEYCSCLRDAELLHNSKNEKRIEEYLQRNSCKYKEN